MTRTHKDEFTPAIKAKAFARANGRCQECGTRAKAGQVNYDHIRPSGLQGKPTLENCRVLCLECHAAKTHTEDRPRMAKADRQAKKHAGVRQSAISRGAPEIANRGFVKPPIKSREPGAKEAQIRAMREGKM
jgi:5-methylcytosine-specific restriction enzyme A